MPIIDARTKLFKTWINDIAIVSESDIETHGDLAFKIFKEKNVE